MSNSSYFAPCNSTLLNTRGKFTEKTWPVIGFLSVVMAIGFVGNGALCGVLIGRMKRTSANLLILWLAINDLVTSALIVPVDVVFLLDVDIVRWPIVCKAFRFTVFLTTMAGETTLLLIAAHRYSKVCHPLKTSCLRRCRVIVVASLCLSFFLSWPALMSFCPETIQSQCPSLNSVSCSCSEDSWMSLVSKIHLLVLIGAFLLEATLLMLFYSRIGYVVFRRSRTVIGECVSGSARNSGSDPLGSDSQIHRRKSSSSSTSLYVSRYRLGRTTALFLTISVTFILSYSPYLVLMILRTVSISTEVSRATAESVLYMFGLRSFYISSSVNAFIYGFINPAFRKECSYVVLKLARIACRKTLGTS